MIPTTLLEEYPFIAVNELMGLWWTDYRSRLTEMGLVEDQDYCRYSYRPQGAKPPTGKLAVCFRDKNHALLASLKWDY